MKLPGVSKLGKIKGLKRKKETVASEETVSEITQEQGSRFGGLKRLIPKRKPKDEAMVEQVVQGEQIIEAQQVMEEPLVEEILQEPTKKRFSKKKIIIIAPIAAVVIILGLPLTGILPENQYLPNVIGIVTGGDLGSITSQISNIGGSGSEQISELEFTISTLEDRIIELEEQLESVSQNSLVGPPGPQGFRGVQGNPGPQGSQGERGASTVPIMLTLGERTTSVPNTIFIGQGFGALDYNAAKILIPVDGTMKNLFVTVSQAPNTDIDFMLVKNGFATDLTCTLSTSTDCSDKIHTISVKAGDTFAVKVSKDFPVNVPPFNIQVSMTLEQS